jgi:PleD family two-component response regulator
LRITTSLGIASLEDDESAQQLLDRADKSLSLAKHAGRDCIRFLS